MKTLKLLYCGCLISLIGCAGSEPAVKKSNADEVRARGEVRRGPERRGRFERDALRLPGAFRELRQEVAEGARDFVGRRRRLRRRARRAAAAAAGFEPDEPERLAKRVRGLAPRARGQHPEHGRRAERTDHEVPVGPLFGDRAVEVREERPAVPAPTAAVEVRMRVRGGGFGKRGRDGEGEEGEEEGEAFHGRPLVEEVEKVEGVERVKCKGKSCVAGCRGIVHQLSMSNNRQCHQ